MSTSFSVNSAQIINSALRLQGWLDYQATADATKLADMLQSLNILVKAWSSEGLKLWTIEEKSFPLVAAQAAYTVGPTGGVVTDRPLRIEYALLRAIVGSNDIPLNRLSRQEYLLLGNKTSAGMPNSYWYDPALTNGVLTLYNTPDASTVAAYTPHIFLRRNIADITVLGDALDFPQEWYQALRWGLAAETCIENQIPASVADRIEMKAKMHKEAMEGWDREWADVTFGIERAAEAFE